MFVRQCNKCKIIIEGKFCGLEGSVWGENDRFIKTIKIDLCPKCLDNFEKWIEEGNKNGGLGNN